MPVSTRPIIGVTANWFPGVPRASYNGKALHVFERQLVDYVVDAGGLPLLLPNRSDLIAHYIERLDGLLVPGGHDVAPGSYGAPVTEWPGQPNRDAVEIAWIRAAQAHDLPVFGICRGLQIINVAHGGTLYDDLPTHRPDCGPHRDSELYDRLSHGMTVEPTSVLAGWLEATTLTVNSVHHQAIREVGDGLNVVATSPDGLVEGIETPDGRLVAVQWHPEWDDRVEQQRLLKAFVARCR